MATLANTTWQSPKFDAGTPAAGSDLRTVFDDIRTSVNSITDAQVAAGANIAGSKLADGGISTAKLADGAVTAIKIANTTITGAKIASGTLTDGLFDYTSVKVARTPHIAGYKMIWGQLSAAAAAANTQDFVIVFTTHSTPAAGATAFSSATNLQVMAIAQGPNSTDILACFQKGAATTTGVTFTVHRVDAANLNTGGTPIILHFLAIGAA